MSSSAPTPSSTVNQLTSTDPIPAINTGSKEQLPPEANEVDITDKICLITGANAGVGFETAVHLARMKAIVVMCCHHLENAEQSRKEIAKRANVSDLSRVRLVELELSDLDDVDAFPSRYDREMGDLKDRPIDIVILNAGIMAPIERKVSKQGIELQLAINVIGHFKFLATIIDRVKRAKHGRIVFVGSQFHLLANGKIDFNDLNREKSYWKWFVYAESKLGTLLLVERLNRLLKQKQLNNLLVVAAHPGYAATKIHVHTFVGYANNYFAQGADKSAKAVVKAAVDPKAEGAGYCGPAYFLYGDPSWGAERSSAIKDEAMQDRFWQACEDLSKARLEEKL